MIVTSKELFKKAKEGNYAIPAVNYIDLDSARAYTKVAEKENKPLILAFAQAHKNIISLEEATVIGKFFAAQVKTPIVLHLDHGEDFDYIKRAIDLGFSSVMIDASLESFEENVRKTKEVVEYAHAKGVVVEAEIGYVGSGVNYENHNESDSVYTEVADAVKFALQTSVDSLAISIGTAHGFYQGTPNINFKRLHEIAKAIDTPLVLHGGSSSGDENLHRCATEGITKINIFTDFISAAIDDIKKSQPHDYIELKRTADKAMEETLSHYYKIFETQ